jgi:hypothetical protein
MITKNMVKEGYNKGIINLIKSPNGDGIVCQIGDNWFYFGGSLAESCETVEEYKSLVLITDIMKDIYEVLKDFQTEFEDEYLYYEYYLKEKGIKERMDVKELNRDELNELKSSYLTKLKEDESPSYQDYINAENIPDEIIFEEYAGITFVKEDFFCNLTDNHNTTEEELTMKEIVKEINKYCNEYLGFVENVGNECAYTDSIVECIIKKAKELKNKYDEEV